MPYSIRVYKNAKTRPSNNKIFFVPIYEPHMSQKNRRSKRQVSWTAEAFHKLHARGYDIHTPINKKGQKLLALLKKTARIPESIFVHQK